MARLVEQGVAVLVVAVGVVYGVFPATVRAAFAPVAGVLVEGVAWAEATLPAPVFLIVAFALITVLAIVVTVWLGRLAYAVLRAAGPRTRRVYRLLAPSTPIGKMGVGITLLTLVAFGSVWVLPAAIGDVGQDGGTGPEQFGGADPEVEGLAMATDDALVRADRTRADTDDRPKTDSDGDRLPDEWEAVGETPAGAGLPDADPDRMDLYVQVNYGGGVYPLTDEEKRQLREVWATMPVENPDGSEGVALHLDDGQRGGPLGAGVTVSGDDYDEVHQFYTDRYVGDRRCVYHQVVVGEVGGEDAYGVANAPGYAVVVDDRPLEYEGDLSPRVHVITHLLLHNVAGDRHADDGWLSPTVAPSDTFLDEETAARLGQRGFAVSGHYRTELC